MSATALERLREAIGEFEGEVRGDPAFRHITADLVNLDRSLERAPRPQERADESPGQRAAREAGERRRGEDDYAKRPKSFKDAEKSALKKAGPDDGDGDSDQDDGTREPDQGDGGARVQED